MEKRRIGRTALEVSVLGFGGNALGNLYAAIDETEARDTVVAARQTGVTYFDTAPLYGHGLSEHRMGDALRTLPRGDIVLSTKVGRLLRPHGKVAPPKLPPSQGGLFTGELPFSPVFDFSYDSTMRSFEDSLQRLGMNRVDILFIHDCDQWSLGPAYEEALKIVESGALRALVRLREEGAIGAFGAGVNQAEACERLMDIGPFDCFMLAGRYTLLEQSALDTFLPRCVSDGVSVIGAAPFNSGILVTGATLDATYNYLPAPEEVKTRVARLEEVGRAFDVPLAAAALQFVLAHQAVVTVIPGARSRAEAEQNARLADAPIPPAYWATIKSEGLLRPDAPVPATESGS